MDATIIARTSTSFTLQVEVPSNYSMLDFEETLQERLNEAGVVATAEGLKPFDTDGVVQPRFCRFPSGRRVSPAPS